MREIESHSFPYPGLIACCSAPNSRPPVTNALHTICGNNTSIVSSSYWWAYKCPKHAEQIISAVKHSVVSSWFSSLRLYYDAQTNIHQIPWKLATEISWHEQHTIQDISLTSSAIQRKCAHWIHGDRPWHTAASLHSSNTKNLERKKSDYILRKT